MPNTNGSSLGGSSLVLGLSQSSFDVSSESEVILLLKLVHQNTLDADVKNHLRDLLFAFRQNQDATHLSPLQEAFLQLGVTITNGSTPPLKKLEVKSSLESQKISAPLGNFRRQPTFAPVILKTVTPVTDTISSEQVVQSAELTQEVLQHKEIIVESSVVAPVPEVIAPQPQIVSTVHHAERIKEIKRMVNEKVGNPVNLIDAHNEIGREYMNALLDAMKKTNGGLPQEVNDAMSRLESAFTQVQGVIFEEKNSEPVEKGEVTPVADMQPVVQSPVAEVSVLDNPIVEPSSVAIQAEESQVIEDIIPEHITMSARESVEPVTEEMPKVVPKMSSVMDTLKSLKPQIHIPPEEVSTVATPNDSVHSVAKEKQLQDLMRSNREKMAQTYKQEEDARIATMDPLQVPEVTAGLSQLLSEWSLFKSSGIFGTGPSGKDHVLYMKLAPLTMAAVIAGRFEGATPHIKQSIADYMNGWRYEEGVSHEHGETFEHYLRKVIRHILDKQKRK